MDLPKILLVDDTKLFLKLEQEYLKHSAVTILTAENGREALELIRSNPPHLVYMDLNMPEMDGITCCAAIKADPDLRSIPVILVTTEGMEDSIARCKSAGCDGFLAKPINRRTFLDMGRKFLPHIDRRERRSSCNIKALLKINNGNNVYGTCVDLCTKGLYISFTGDVVVEDKVEVSMLLTGNSADLVEAWGRVAWINNGSYRKKPQLPEGFGIEIQAITEESLGLLRKFLR